MIAAIVAETDTAAGILKDSMIDTGKIYLKEVPIVVDVLVADNWYQK
jgi:DNA polymerase I-like protein with 3'-5' exonuclease and polymerase domains